MGRPRFLGPEPKCGKGVIADDGDATPAQELCPESR